MMPITFFMPVNELSVTPKMPLELGTTTVYVNRREATVISCRPNDKFFLFTDCLASCFAILVFCRLKTGNTMIGLGHTPCEEGNFEDNLFSIKENVEQEKFQPNMLKSLLKHVRSYAHDEPINVYLVSGRESGFNRARKAHYEEYIKTQIGVTLKGALLNPFHLTNETDELIDQAQHPAYDFSFMPGASAGITANGTPIINRMHDIDFNGKQFSNVDDLKVFLSKNNINYQSKLSLELQDVDLTPEVSSTPHRRCIVL